MAIVVDDGGEGHLQLPVVQFLTAAAPRAVFAINMLNPQSIRLNDFTGSGDLLQRSVARLVQRGRVPRDWTVLADAVSDASIDFRKRKVSRPAIVVLTNGGEAVEREVANPILEELRRSGAALHLIMSSARNWAWSSSKGRRAPAAPRNRPPAPPGLARLPPLSPRRSRTNTSSRTSLPSGVRPGLQLQVSTTRAKVKIVAPHAFPTTTNSVARFSTRPQFSSAIFRTRSIACIGRLRRAHLGVR